MDVHNLLADLTPADFVFSMIGPGHAGGWVASPVPTITRRPGAGVEGESDRIMLVWPDGSIVNRWLSVTVLPSAGTA